MISKFNHRASGLTLHVNHTYNRNGKEAGYTSGGWWQSGRAALVIPYPYQPD